MKLAARVLFALAAISFSSAGCRQTAPQAPTAAAPATPVIVSDALAPSPRLIVGRIVAVDAGRRFAFVELTADAPAGAVGGENDLMARTPDLRETAQLRASRYVRGRTLGTTILAGKPNVGDEVVWLAP